MKKSEIITTLKLFCSKDDPRLQDPFCENGNTYATDQRVFVCYEGFEASAMSDEVLKVKNVWLVKACIRKGERYRVEQHTRRASRLQGGCTSRARFLFPEITPFATAEKMMMGGVG